MTSPASSLSSELIDRFVEIVGADHALRDPQAIAPHLVEQRGLYHGRTPVVLKPGSVAEVAAILKLANETRTAIVPQGGNTGLVGGQVPDDSGREIVVAMGRLNRIRQVDPEGDTMTVEAGVTLAEAQAAAEAAGRLFPLSLASEGSCQIGGNLSTNAGGTAVLAYGNTRELVLGVEAVLASGEVWNGLRTLRKDNTGYDLKDLFVGGEGTLGIITAAVLKLFPRPRGVSAAFVGLRSPAEALKLPSSLSPPPDRR
jgi:FAD/FMN-containing dehydrogenase